MTDVISGEAYEEADLASSYQWASQSEIYSVLHVAPVHCLAVPVAPLSTGSGVLAFPTGSLGELEEQLGHGTVRLSDTVEWTAPSDVFCEVVFMEFRTVERRDECTDTARECWGVPRRRTHAIRTGPAVASNRGRTIRESRRPRVPQSGNFKHQRKSRRNLASEHIRILPKRQREQILAVCQVEIQKHERLPDRLRQKKCSKVE